jgi:methylated-DNA-protein-cysteine methyltransferase-like protein
MAPAAGDAGHTMPWMPTSRGRNRAPGQFEDAVRAVVEGLRPGELATYGEVAEESGFPGAARAVGGVMARSQGLAWWRVVAANGRLVPGHEAEQARRLRSEGIAVLAGRAVVSSRPARPVNGTKLRPRA